MFGEDSQSPNLQSDPTPSLPGTAPPPFSCFLSRWWLVLWSRTYNYRTNLCTCICNCNFTKNLDFQEKTEQLLSSGECTREDLCYSLQECVFAMLVEITGKQLLNIQHTYKHTNLHMYTVIQGQARKCKKKKYLICEICDFTIHFGFTTNQIYILAHNNSGLFGTMGHLILMLFYRWKFLCSKFGTSNVNLFTF